VNLSEMDARDMHNDVEPENPVVEKETGDVAARLTYKDGTVTWELRGHKPDEVQQDALEEAYDLGFQRGRGRGAYEAARTVYGGRRDG
jgi:hypothetical protein